MVTVYLASWDAVMTLSWASVVTSNGKAVASVERSTSARIMVTLFFIYSPLALLQ